MQVNTGQDTVAPVRVLLADSGALVLEQLSALLTQARCDVLTVNDGFEVLCRLPELRPDVLVVAADLPRLSGIQVCSLLRKSPDFSELPVLVLTGANTTLDRVRAKMAGANACLEKPFRGAELQAAFAALFPVSAGGAAECVTVKTAQSTTSQSTTAEHIPGDLPVYC